MVLGCLGGVLDHIIGIDGGWPLFWYLSHSVRDRTTPNCAFTPRERNTAWAAGWRRAQCLCAPFAGHVHTMCTSVPHKSHMHTHDVFPMDAPRSCIAKVWWWCYFRPCPWSIFACFGLGSPCKISMLGPRPESGLGK